MAASDPAQHNHRRRMRASHLNNQSGLDLIPRLGAFDERQRGVHRGLGKAPSGKSRRHNQLMK
jgi:hypothetical protein